MHAPSPLARPVWSALATRQAPLSQGDARARRFAPDYGPFGAAADADAASLAALAALIAPGGTLWLAEEAPLPLPFGTSVVSEAPCLQMVAIHVDPPPPDPTIVPLSEADAAAMHALATLTRPGPFHAATHRLGRFVGIREGGRLVAMAGERMQPEGHTEVSGVCTHPDARGRGHAGALTRAIAAGILARGETPFLHVYASNAGAVALYETLGFRITRTIVATVIARG